MSIRKAGIAGRLAIFFVAVAILAVVVIWIVAGRVPLLQTSRVEHATPAPVSQSSAALQTVAPAPIRRPFPSPEPLLRALDRIDRAVDAGAEGDVTERVARYPKLAAELDRAAAQFAAAAAAAGEKPPPRFNSTVRSYRQRAADLIRLAAGRRALMAEYSTHFEKLNTRVRKSRLVKLTGNLADLRRSYAEFVAAYTVDPSTFDSLGASEAALISTLSQDRAGFTHAQGADWYAGLQDDLQAMSSARKALLQIDRQRRKAARKFGDDSATLAQIVKRMGKTETYVAPRDAAASVRFLNQLEANTP